MNNKPSMIVNVPAAAIAESQRHVEHAHYNRDVNPVTFMLKHDGPSTETLYLFAENPGNLRAAADRLIELAAEWEAIIAATRRSTTTHSETITASLGGLQ